MKLGEVKTLREIIKIYPQILDSDVRVCKQNINLNTAAFQFLNQKNEFRTEELRLNDLLQGDRK